MYEWLTKGVLVAALLFSETATQVTTEKNFFSFDENVMIRDTSVEEVENVVEGSFYDDVKTNTDTVTVTYPEYTVVESSGMDKQEVVGTETTDQDNSARSDVLPIIPFVVCFVLVLLLILLRRRGREIDA